MWPFRRERTRPAVIPTDTIIPLHLFDDTQIFRKMVLHTMLRFDDVLDTDKIRTALTTLMEQGNWRKLGARLRLNDAGKLEYHVPQYYSEERPAFRFTQENYGMKIEEHELASQIPRPTARPSMHKDPSEFISLYCRSGAPTKLEDYIYSDEPQLSFHTVSFENATLFSFSWVHCFSDGMGIKEIMNALSMILSGQVNNIPEFSGFESDLLAPCGTTPGNPTVEKAEIKGLGVFRYVFNLVWELFWWKKENQQTICLPASYIKDMTQRANKRLQTEEFKQFSSNIQQKSLFVSESDVICAWWARMATQHLPHDSTRTICITNAMNIRHQVTGELLPVNTAYIANAVTSAITLVPIWEIFKTPLSFVAFQIRRCIREQGTREGIEAKTHIIRKAREKSGYPPLIGDPGMLMLNFSNWAKLGYFDIDFSPAVIKQGRSSHIRESAIGKPSFVNVAGSFNGLPLRNNTVVAGKDAAGNYWISPAMRSSLWPGIEKTMTEM